jgi:hypothetical protein
MGPVLGRLSVLRGRSGVYNLLNNQTGICMSARIEYDINASSSIAMTVSILSGGHPHPTSALCAPQGWTSATHKFNPARKFSHSIVSNVM